jgi:hypothetical protein
MKRALTAEDAETIAIQALGFLAGDAERLGRFLAVTGLGPHNLRAAAADPHFLAGVLAHVTQDDSLLAALAGNLSMKPEAIMAAHAVMAGPAPPDL